MDTEYPLHELNLIASSVADDLGFVALADVAKAVAAMNASKDCRLIGGHMVTLHAQRWGIDRELYRETRDADIGIATIALKRVDTTALMGAQGYRKISGCHFEKEAGVSAEKAIIDILVPSYRSRARNQVRVGGLVTTEVSGLATALRREPVVVDVTMHRLQGEQLMATLILPDEVSALCLKVAAYTDRHAGKDAVDVWRCMEVMHRAGMSLSNESDSAAKAVHTLIAGGFARLTSPMMAALIAQHKLSSPAAQQRYTRMQALMKQIL